MNAVNKQHVQLPRTLDASQLAQLQAQARQKLLEGVYNGHQWVYPCADRHSFQGFDLALEYTQQSVKEGKEIYQHDPAVNSGFYYGVSFWKPKEEIESILKASDLEVEQKLKEEIESFNAEQVELLTQQLVNAELAKEKKKEEDRLAVIQAKAAATAAKHIQDQLKEAI